MKASEKWQAKQISKTNCSLIFAALAFMKLLGNVSMSPIFIVMIIYTIVYFIFAMISFIHSSRMIKHSI